MMWPFKTAGQRSKAFSIREIFRTSWKLTRAHFGFLLAGFFFYLGIRIVFQILAMGTAVVAPHVLHHALSKKEMILLLIPFGLAGGLAGFVIYLGWLRAVLRIVRGEARRWSDLISGGPYTLRGLGTAILTGLAIFGGFLLLIVPGILWTLRFSQTLFVAVDENPRPVAALRRSAALTKGAKKDLLILFLLVCLCNVLGLCALLIGVLFTLPFSIVAMAVAYERLRVPAAPAASVFEKV